MSAEPLIDSLLEVANDAEWVRRLLTEGIDPKIALASLTRSLAALPDDIRAAWLPPGEATRQAFENFKMPDA